MQNLLDAHSEFDVDGNDLILKACQTISSEHIDRLRAQKDASLAPMKNELNRVASVPVVIVERWLREGFNIYSAPARDIIARLKREGLDHFVTTKRSI